MALLNFDASTVESTSFEPVPAGQYEAVITDSEIQPTRTGTGSYLKLTFSIVSGEWRNRLLFTRLNLDNPNPVAVRIAQEELSAICRAVGVLPPKDSAELHGLPMLVRVRVIEGDNGPQNEIRGYRALPKQTQPAPVRTAPVTEELPW